jgi:hypothetical protein
VADVFEVYKNVLNLSTEQDVAIYVQCNQYPGDYSLWVFNSAGEHIRTLDSKVLTGPISQTYLWDGKNKYGELCASGVYVFYLVEPSARKIKRILLTR